MHTVPGPDYMQDLCTHHCMHISVHPTRDETATLRLGRPSSGAAVAASKLNSRAQAAAVSTAPLTLTLQQSDHTPLHKTYCVSIGKVCPVYLYTCGCAAQVRCGL